jgi:lipopolysaccharide/colanic/teichoic acid biosynthesis glycosyltransferase
MKTLNHKQIYNLTLKIGLIVLLVGLFVSLEPNKPTGYSFVSAQLDASKSAASSLTSGNPIEEIPVNYGPQQKTRAPEPSTLFLVLSGVGGMIVRFARTSFKRFKRLLDILLATLGLFVTAPILLFAAFLIKLTSRGPVIYKQLRVGERSKIFKIYKLRTMIMDAEKGTGAIWAKENDPRITSIGRVLRKTRIDEIPQFINVIKGEMSIVGPRPERPEMVRDFKKLIGDYEKRLTVKPGITGIAQIYHKYDESLVDVRKKLKYDLLYSKKMSPATDFAILAQTCLVVLTGKGAR